MNKITLTTKQKSVLDFIFLLYVCFFAYVSFYYQRIIALGLSNDIDFHLMFILLSHIVTLIFALGVFSVKNNKSIFVLFCMFGNVLFYWAIWYFLIIHDFLVFLLLVVLLWLFSRNKIFSNKKQ